LLWMTDSFFPLVSMITPIVMISTWQL
jgi:hypothetical protein